MWKKIISLFKSNQICVTITKAVKGINSALVVLAHIKVELESSKSKSSQVLAGYLDKVTPALTAINETLQKVFKGFCGDPATIVAKGSSLEDSLAELDQISKDLKNL